MRFWIVVVASVLFVSGSAAHADSITAGSVPTFVLGPSSDTLSFNTANETINLPGTFTQTGIFYVGDSEIPNQTVSFTFTDDVTVNGISKNLVFQGEDIVTTGPDTLSIDALGPVMFGDQTLWFNALTVEGNGSVGQSLPVTLSASTATPEPSSIALLGTSLLGAAVFLRRKRRA